MTTAVGGNDSRISKPAGTALANSTATAICTHSSLDERGMASRRMGTMANSTTAPRASRAR